jgi:adenylate cyclase
MTKIIFERRGTIDKYVGDMIMAFWGAPLPDERHCLHAIEAALEMLVAVRNMGDDFERRGWPRISIGIGINSGQMNVGDMGSEYRRSYTVIGDAVNLGSRLEGLTKYYGVELIVNETTCAGQDSILFRQLDKVRVKGKHEPVSIYEPICRIAAASVELRREVESYHQALECYFAARWPEAQHRFDELMLLQPDSKLYRLYRERVGELAGAGIADGWDGVYTHTSK